MPYPNRHSCRVKAPGQFQEGSFRTIHTGEGDDRLDIIIGRPKGSTKTTAQAYRYDKKVWTKSRAGAHCKKHGGAFEAAANESVEVNEMADKPYQTRDGKKYYSQAFAIVPDSSKSSTWKLPHHVAGDLPHAELPVDWSLMPGAWSAAVKGESRGSKLDVTMAQRKAAAGHLRQHYRDVDREVPDDLQEFLGEAATSVGQPAGRMQGDRAGAGPGGECICPKCGHRETHDTGEPCNKRECPECGATMTRVEETKESTIDESQLVPLNEVIQVELHPLDEGKKRDPNRPLRVRGKGQQAGIITENENFYSAAVLKEGFDEALPRIKGRQCLMEVEHPTDKGHPYYGSLLNTAGIVKEAHFENDTGAVMLDEMHILPTSQGKDLAVLVEAGVPVGISQRGRGVIRRERRQGRKVNVVQKLIIDSWDFVIRPSVKDARVTGILESMRERRRTMKKQGISNELMEAFREQYPSLESVSDADLIQIIIEAQKGAPGLLEAQTKDEFKKLLDEKKDMIDTLLEIGRESETDRLRAMQETAQAVAAKEAAEKIAEEAKELAEQKVTEADAKVKEAEQKLTELQEAQRVAEAQDYGRKKVEETTYGRRHKDLLVESIKEAKTKEEIDTVLENRSKLIDASLAQDALRQAGWTGSPVRSQDAIITLAESLPPVQQGAAILNEAYRDAMGLPSRDLSKTRQGRLTMKLLEMYDRQNAYQLAREAKEMLTLIKEDQTTAQIALPYTVSRMIIEQALPETVMLGLADVAPAESADVRVPVETYAEETSGLVTGSSSDIEIGECEPIKLARLTVTLETLSVEAKRLGAKICDEAMVFSASQLPNYNLQARLLSNIVKDIQRYINAKLIALARAAATAQANNDGGPFALSGGPGALARGLWLNGFIRCIGYAKVFVINRYYDENPVSVLMSYTNADELGNADQFTAAGKVPVSDLDAFGYVGRVKGRPVFQTTELADDIALVGDFKCVKHRILKAMEIRGPFPIYDTTTVELVAGEQWYAQTYTGEKVFTAERGKLAYVSIT